MADLDLSGNSHLINLVYNDTPKEAVDPKELAERLKKERAEKMEENKQRRIREKEIEKEESKRMREAERAAGAYHKEVTIERVRVPVNDDDAENGFSDVKIDPDTTTPPPQQRKKKGGCQLSGCCIFCLLLLFLAAAALSFWISYETTHRLVKGPVVIEEDGIRRFGGQLGSLEEDFDEDNLPFRLPRHIEPICATRELVLHASKLNLPTTKDGWEILSESNSSGLEPTHFSVISVAINETSEEVRLELSEDVHPGSPFYLSVAYNGPFSQGKNGLYGSTYRTPEGEVRHLAMVDGEPAYARRFVPCMDEPDRKAIFRLNVIHPRGTNALSNGLESEAEDTEEPSWVKTSFSPTPKMASYLFMLIVSDFVSATSNSTNGIPIRAWAPPHLIDHTEFGRGVAVRMLDYYEKYFEIPYPMEKLDLVAAPEFAFSAMENWGIIVFEQSSLLFDPRLTTPLQKMAVAETVSHEISHQWFGNLVTMKWWSDLWLNEAFATHQESFATARSGVMPELDDLFYVRKQKSAFTADQYSGARPVSTPVRTLVAMEQMFDDVTYDKGGCLVRQLEDIIGPELFRKGIVAYLKKYAYSNAKTNDLLDVIVESLPESMKSSSNASYTDLKAMMQRFARQNGYPTLRMDRPDTAHITVEEEKKDKKQWQVPLFYELNNVPQPLTWVTDGISLPSEQDEVVVLNADSKGYYRVLYDPRGWSRLVKEVQTNHTNLSELSRMRILEDAFSFAEKGELPFEIPLELLEYIPKEDDTIPVISAVLGLDSIRGRFGDEPEGEAVDRFAHSTLSPLEKRYVNWADLSFKNDSNAAEAILVKDLVNLLHRTDHFETSSKILEMFRKGLVEPCTAAGPKALPSRCSKVPPIVRAIAYCEGIRRGGREEFDLVVRLHNNAIVNLEKERLLAALSCSQDTYLLKKLFQALLDKEGEGVFHGARFDEYVMLTTIDDELSRKVFNEFFYDNYKALKTRYSDNPRVFTFISESVSARSRVDIADLEAFLDQYPEAKEYEGFSRALEDGRKEFVEWRRKHGKNVVDFLEKQKNRT